MEAIFRIELKTKGYKALVLPLNYIAIKTKQNLYTTFDLILEFRHNKLSCYPSPPYQLEQKYKILMQLPQQL